MSKNDKNNSPIATDDPFQVVQDAVSARRRKPQSLEAAKDSLQSIADASREAQRSDVAQLAKVLAQLVEVLRLDHQANDSLSPAEAKAIAKYVADGIGQLRNAFFDADIEQYDLEALCQQASQRWPDWFEMTGAADGELSEEDSTTDEVELTDPTSDQIDLILGAIDNVTDLKADCERQPNDELASSATAVSRPVTPQNITIEGELLEAYLDDAGRCLAQIEASCLAFEQNSADRQSLAQICRELHTLKGASGSIGLTELATYLHDIEERLQNGNGDFAAASAVELILGGLDAVRDQIDAMSSGGTHTAETTATSPVVPAPNVALDAPSADSGDTIRVKVRELDRLMDMLSELIMLRNRREASVGQLQNINEELFRCAHHARTGQRHHPQTEIVGSRRGEPIGSSTDRAPHELASDLAQLHRDGRELCGRFAAENDSVTHFIRQFRQSLVELRRVPVAGLFARLQRVARDAARVEGKQVELRLFGEKSGLERSLQERLYEPLLHIIRNAVSHGIETSEERAAIGKSSVGTVTLEARAATHMLVIDVSDDGRGLDYDALRRRGIECGLIAADRLVSDDELAQLIFHPGFSTRSDTSEMSGRGVGMDVVAATLQRMRGWIEVQSEPGRGTRVRLSIPLRTGIEHAMVFRAGGQLFAIPLQSVSRVETDLDQWRQNDAGRGIPQLELASILGVVADARPGGCLVLDGGPAWDDLRKQSQPAGMASTQRQQLCFFVDETVGPEEMVVRPLPPLLRRHQLLAGVTLSGTGETIFLIDNRRLLETCRQHLQTGNDCSATN